MSINVYLKDEVQQAEEFEARERSERGQHWKDYTFKGFNVFLEKGRFHVILHHLDETIPDSLVEFVQEISCYEWVPLRPSRICGIYKHEDSEAQLDVQGDHYELRIRGKTLPPMYELYRKIRAGNITPEENWDTPQPGAVSRMAPHEDPLDAFMASELLRGLAKGRELDDLDEDIDEDGENTELDK